jgi:hypothetical protein
VNTQTTADRLKMIATARSGMRSSRPMAGSSDCIAVLPAAATSITEKSTANRSRERPKPFISLVFAGIGRSAVARRDGAFRRRGG